ncbi:odorant receptor 94b-like [Bradysia coprophila]|uniref:odorant receptor 94b-like n=1 Tax=Bradysia coprophila TaxID=38358 RepID=UPI00187D972C|nr:odorant receptor 94b-like [Bradysia coprophila]
MANIGARYDVLKYRLANLGQCKTVNGKHKEIPTFVFIVSFFTVFLTEIFLPCYFGNEIILKHQSLSLAIYSSDWIKAPARYRKFVVLFMEMLNIDVVMKTGKIFTLTLSSFLTVINRSYSLFAVLQNTLNR